MNETELYRIRRKVIDSGYTEEESIFNATIQLYSVLEKGIVDLEDYQSVKKIQDKEKK